ncbi:MAG: S1-like domain-containing RNA-binding protein [Eubacteriales bacterium]|nr:S1-like domain-containing RNA-binding protein [Eubacteriales bacterium]
MIRLGEMQTLEVVRKSPTGVQLSSRDNPAEEVLLPKSLMPSGLKEADEIEVFVYRDSEGRLTATTQRPKITLDEVAFLRVKEVAEVGAFLDWGLPKDLFLPYQEQTARVREGKEYLVGLYVDNSDRLCATMRIYDFLRTDSAYKMDEWVTGIIYDLENDIGALVAVDRKFNALIPKSELVGSFNYGDIVKARVARVREDGKLDLSLKERPFIQIDRDAGLIMAELKEKGGVLYLNDKSTPEEIYTQLGMSKGSFKKAVGRLLKEKSIRFIEHGIELID